MCDGVCSGVGVADSRSCVPLLLLCLLWAAAVVGVGAVASSDVAATVDVVVCECVCDARRSMFAGVCVPMCVLSAVVDVAWWRSDGAAWCECHVVLCCAMDCCWCVSCRRLDLHNNELNGSIPSTLGKLTSLQ